MAIEKLNLTWNKQTNFNKLSSLPRVFQLVLRGGGGGGGGFSPGVFPLGGGGGGGGGEFTRGIFPLGGGNLTRSDFDQSKLFQS